MVFTQDAAANVAQLGHAFPRPELLQAATVDRSLQELEARQEAMIADLELVREGLLSIVGVPGADYDLSISVPRNALIVVLEDANAEAVRAFQLRYGSDVIVEQGPIAVPDDCTRMDCRYNLRSGLRVDNVDGGGCSSAFTVRIPSGTRQLLSAGHCTGVRRFHAGEEYGEVRQSEQSGRVDAERHSVVAPFEARARILVDSGEKDRVVGDTGTWESLLTGIEICMSGATSGKKCGDVLEKHFSPSYVPDGNRFIKTTYCGEGGDSGAGVYRKDRADGIHSGGAPRSCGDPQDYSLFGHIEYAQNRLSVTVVTGA